MKKYKKIDIEDISKEEIFDNLQRCISEKIDYWNRINKAIEYFSVNYFDFNDDRYYKMIDILKGKDNE